MPVVVADTGPLRYLLAIGHVDILPRLFEKLSIPLTTQVNRSPVRAGLNF